MGIQRIESVTYGVEDLETCVSFFTDFGLDLAVNEAELAEFRTLAGQTLRLILSPDPEMAQPLESGPTVLEVVWGVDTQEELDRLVSQVSSDRDVRFDQSGTAHFLDETGFGVGLTLAAAVEPNVRDLADRNRWGAVERWNEAVTPIETFRPTRMCHVALNIPQEGSAAANAFYTDRLELIPTDVVEPMGTFMRCEGDADQHNFLLCHRPNKAGINHVSYEVPSFDDVVEGGNHMIERGWTETRKLGRHTIGSNVFRFFHAPCGGRVELAADMDRVDDSYGVRVHTTTPPHNVWTLRGNRDAQSTEESA